MGQPLVMQKQTPCSKPRNSIQTRGYSTDRLAGYQVAGFSVDEDLKTAGFRDWRRKSQIGDESHKTGTNGMLSSKRSLASAEEQEESYK
jgi:hypothetical protein